jgi:beta-glucosidase
MSFVVEPGTIEVMLGSSAEDIRLRGEFEIVGETTVVGWDRGYSTPARVE